jgi:hypothetical protein
MISEPKDIKLNPEMTDRVLTGFWMMIVELVEKNLER